MTIGRGCLTAVLSCAVMCIAVQAGAQISPGPLAKAHAQLEGALNCAKCHGPRKSAMSASCLSCHREIAWLVDRNRGYHARRETRARECSACHPDHAGAAFDLIAWPGGARERFDHRTAGWTLEASHRDLACDDCHAAAYRTSEAAALSRRTSGAGWVGLEPACASCHRDDDEHRGALGAKCETCHDSRDWAPAPRFSHDSTDYPLTGKHADASCNDCHLASRLPLRHDARGQPIPIYAPVPFQSCGTCHDDPHRGRLSARCADCHATTGWEAAVDGRRFNHNRTKYPLEGRHARVPCAACHGQDLARPNPAFDTCAGCHRDPHDGTAVLAGKPSDCGACHRVEGFTPSTFTVAQHAAAPYPLEGRHTQVACVKCHTRADSPRGARPANVARLRMPFARCTDCHADAHDAQIAERSGGGSGGGGGGGACEACHAVAGWTPSTFTAAQHAALRIRLDGRHGEIPCRACHGPDRPGLPAPTGASGSARVALTLTERRCADCHADPHAGRYAPGGPVAVDGDCGACHTAVSFRPSLVDAAQHERFTFRLDGAHRAVACVSCHETLRAPKAASTLLSAAKAIAPYPVLPARPRTCESCHQNPHGEQFAGRKDARCEACHGVESFAPATRFDHERDAAFSLRGAHAKAACAACHVVAGGGGSRMTIYRPLSGSCESCHGRRPPS